MLLLPIVAADIAGPSPTKITYATRSTHEEWKYLQSWCTAIRDNYSECAARGRPKTPTKLYPMGMKVRRFGGVISRTVVAVGIVLMIPLLSLIREAHIDVLHTCALTSKGARPISGEHQPTVGTAPRSTQKRRESILKRYCTILTPAGCAASPLPSPPIPSPPPPTPPLPPPPALLP